MAKISAATASSMVAGKRSKNVPSTGSPVRGELPKSPCSKRFV